MPAQGNNPVFAALAVVDSQHAALQIGVIDGESAELIQADAGGIEQFEHGPVTDTGHGAEVGLIEDLLQLC